MTDRPKLAAAKAAIERISKAGYLEDDLAEPPRLIVDAEAREIYLCGDIGSPLGLVDGAAFAMALKEIGNRDVTIRLTTRGGCVETGIGIFNMLRRHAGKVTCVADGRCHSIGSVILQAGHRRVIAPGTAIMVHLPWSGVQGDHSEMDRAAELLRRFGDEIIAIYTKRTGHDAAKIREMLEAETWMFGAQAVEQGFCDEVETFGAFPLRAAVRRQSVRHKSQMIGMELEAMTFAASLR